jgi:Family of unknown function (DUF6459)
MSVAPELPDEPRPAREVVLLRAVDCGPPPEAPSSGGTWRSPLLDSLPVLLPVPAGSGSVAPAGPSAGAGAAVPAAGSGAAVPAGSAAGLGAAAVRVGRPRRLAVAAITDAEARALVASTARVVLEVLEGRRSTSQLAPMLNERAMAAVQTMLRGGLRWPVRRAVVRSVHVALPSPNGIEACVVFCSGQRHRALALRLTRERRRWMTTAIRVG